MTEMDIDRQDSAIVTGVDQFDTGKIEDIGEYVGPEELLKDLIERVRRYHPSDDISLITKAYELAEEAHKDQVSLISFIPFRWPSFWQTWKWTKRP